MSKETLYFVFDADVHRRHMGLGARIVGQGELTDYRLGFCGDVATLVPCKGRKVQGMRWALSLEMEKAMDWKKGYPDGIYEKQEVMVRGKYGQEYMVMAYIPDRIAAMHHALPSAEYFGRMVEGYCQHGLQTQGLFESLKDTHRDLMAAEDRLHRVNMERKKAKSDRNKPR